MMSAVGGFSSCSWALLLVSCSLAPNAAAAAAAASGWAFRKSGGLGVWREGSVAIIGVPYSEHSSYSELRSCVARLRPKLLIPTVNAATKQAREQVVDRWGWGVIEQPTRMAEPARCNDCGAGLKQPAVMRVRILMVAAAPCLLISHPCPAARPPACVMLCQVC